MNEEETLRSAAMNARAVLAGLLDAPIGTAITAVVLAHKILDDALVATEKK